MASQLTATPPSAGSRSVSSGSAYGGLAAAPLDRDTESPLEDAVQKSLQDRGWTVHPQVGVDFAWISASSIRMRPAGIPLGSNAMERPITAPRQHGIATSYASECCAG